METTRSEQNGVTVVTVSQLNISYSDLEALQNELFEIIDSDVDRLVLDLAQVTTMDSFGVGVVMSAYRRMQKKAGAFKLAAVTAKVRSALAITKVDTVIEIHNSVEEACASFGAEV